MEFLIIGLFILAIYFIPTFIAFYRSHTYKWVISGINTFAIAAGVLWLAAFIWAVWPTNKSLSTRSQAMSQGRELEILEILLDQ